MEVWYTDELFGSQHYLLALPNNAMPQQGPLLLQDSFG